MRLLLLAFLTLPLFAYGEGYVGITQQSEYEAVEYEIPVPPKQYGAQNLQPPSANNNQKADQQKDKAYNGKIDKIDNWTKQAYGLLNDGSQEKYTNELTRVYEEQVQEIKNGGLGYRPEFRKYKEKKMPKMEQ